MHMRVSGPALSRASLRKIAGFDSGVPNKRDWRDNLQEVGARTVPLQFFYTSYN